MTLPPSQSESTERDRPPRLTMSRATLDERDAQTEWRLLVRLERNGLLRDGLTATDAQEALDD